MKKLMFLSLFITAAVSAEDYTTQKIGEFTFISSPNGYQSTTQQLGPYTITNDNKGAITTSQQVGGYTFTHTDQNVYQSRPMYLPNLPAPVLIPQSGLTNMRKHCFDYLRGCR